MQLETTRFGKIDIDEQEIIIFNHGLYGFKDEREFVLLVDEGTPFFWLQSINSPDLSFIVTEPWGFCENYEFDLNDSVQEELKIESEEEILVVNIIVVPDNPKEMTMNLKAPIIVNKDENLAKQVILDEEEWPVKYRMLSGQRQEAANC